MTDYTDLQKAAEYAAQDTIKFADESEEMRAHQQFHEEVDPETVLALIAENERLESEAVYAAAGFDAAREEIAKLRAERDQLKAENDRLKSENDEPEWHLMMTKLEDQNSQLRAETAGLKTGYEAYERVNAELKVECGALCDELKNLRSDKAQLIYALKQEEQNYLALRTERDRFKTDNEALRDDVEQNQYDANAWRNSEESVWIEVFNSEGDDPFISAITGQITVEQLALIQAEILEYREDYFEKGSGLYVFRCAHYQAHHDNVGMTEPAHWETDFESYSPFPWEEEAAAMGQGEQS